VDAAAANYQGVVLDALREVTDVLRALDGDARAVAAGEGAADAAHEVAASLGRQHTLGTASRAQALAAQQVWHQARIDLLGAQAQRLANGVALYLALGGGAGSDAARAVGARP
jgi:outer membrane protein TolC